MVLVAQPLKRERSKKKETKVKAKRTHDAELLLNGTMQLQKLIDAKGPAEAIVKHCKEMMRAARRDAKRKKTRLLTH